jgi:ATP-dependent DNA ligase
MPPTTPRLDLPVTPPLAPMLARLARALPEGDFVYEPKWDGFRCLAFRDGDAVDLRSRNDRPLARYFPEVVAALAALPEPRMVLDGELVVIAGEEFQFETLMARLHPAESRARLLAESTPATFIAFDVLAVDSEDLRATPFAQRRARLESMFAEPPPRVGLPPPTSPRRRAGWRGRRAAGWTG